MNATAKWQQTRSFWTWGYESDEPDEAARKQAAVSISRRLGREVKPPQIPRIEDIELRAARVKVPAVLEDWVSSAHAERLLHTHGGHPLELLAGLRGEFAAPPDAVAHPRDDVELEATLVARDDRASHQLQCVDGKVRVGPIVRDPVMFEESTQLEIHIGGLVLDSL